MFVCNVWFDPARANRVNATHLLESASSALWGFQMCPFWKETDPFWEKNDHEHHRDCKYSNSFRKNRFHVNDIEHHVVWSATFCGVDRLLKYGGKPYKSR